MSLQTYTQEYYQNICTGSMQSARVIVPLVLDLVKPRSVIDIGCGVGTWLAVFRELGVKDIFGLDGDYVDQSLLTIPREHFLAHDLTKPFRVNRRFDLAISMEVAEHLPAASAKVFVESIANLAPVVLFSAAIPFQGGMDHKNEQWPSYWASLFQAHNFVAIDCIRREVWNDSRVEWWYTQNALLFAKLDYVLQHSRLRTAFALTHPDQLALVHPRQYLHAVGIIQHLQRSHKEQQ